MKAIWAALWPKTGKGNPEDDVPESRFSSDYLFTLAIVGDPGVGKSSIVHQFEIGRFSEGGNITSDDVHIHMMQLDGSTIQLEMWDLPCGNRFNKLRAEIYKRAHGILVVYDSTNKESFMQVRQWLDEVKSSARKNIALLVIGNKCDAFDKRAIDTQTAQEFVNELGCSLLETSSKDGARVEKAFVTIARDIKERMAGELAMGETNGRRKQIYIKPLPRAL